MSYVQITKPNQGDATRKALIDAVIDNQAYFNSILTGLSQFVIPNGGFEYDTDSDGTPDGWLETLYTGGSFSRTGVGESDANRYSGRKGIKFVHPGGAGNGGGYIESEDFVEIYYLDQPIYLKFAWSNSNAGVFAKAELRFYDGDLNFIDSVNVFESDAEQLTFAIVNAGTLVGQLFPTAQFLKVRLTGGDPSATVGGTVYFDAVSIFQKPFQRQVFFDKPTRAGEWVCPAGVYHIFVEVIGAGGNGGSVLDNHSSGGGGGAYVAAMINVQPGQNYQLEVGQGGRDTTHEPEQPLTDNYEVVPTRSRFLDNWNTPNRDLIAGEGQPGGGTNAGAGGIASGGDINIDGIAGTVRTTTGDADFRGGGNGGYCPPIGARGKGIKNDEDALKGDRGGNSPGPGGGGGGANLDLGKTVDGGNGGDGLVIISW